MVILLQKKASGRVWRTFRTFRTWYAQTWSTCPSSTLEPARLLRVDTRLEPSSLTRSKTPQTGYKAKKLRQRERTRARGNWPGAGVNTHFSTPVRCRTSDDPCSQLALPPALMLSLKCWRMSLKAKTPQFLVCKYSRELNC